MTLINWETDRIFHERDKLIVHETIIRPLLIASKISYIFKGTAAESRMPDGTIIEKPIDLDEESILKQMKGRYIFDKSKECITGNEYLWNASGCKRGSIVLLLPNTFDFSYIFSQCYVPGMTQTPNMGQTPAALSICHKALHSNDVAVIFSASNGIEHMAIYAAERQFCEISSLAQKKCRDRTAWLSEPHMITDKYKGTIKDSWQYKQVERVIDRVYDKISENMSLCSTIPHKSANMVIRTLFSQFRSGDILLMRFSCLKLWEVPLYWLEENMYDILTMNFENPNLDIDDNIWDNIFMAFAHTPNLYYIIHELVYGVDLNKITISPNKEAQRVNFYINTMKHMEYLGII